MALKTLFTKIFGSSSKTSFSGIDDSKVIDKIEPRETWLNEYEEKKVYLKSKINYWDQYERISNNNFENTSGDVIKVAGHGTINIHDEYILVCDPIAGISWDLAAYFKKTSQGEFPIETLLIQSPKGECFNSSTRIRFSEDRPKEYIQALEGREDIGGIKSDKLFGFSSASGFVGIMDIKTKKEYLDEISKFQAENPELNWYDDVFIHRIEEAKEDYPQYNNRGVNLTNYKLDKGGYSVPIISLPFKNIGTYPVFFGINEDDEVVELVIHYMEVDI